MPTYEYICTYCGDKFEHFQSMKDQPLKLCKKCEGPLKKMVSGGLDPVFKGKGFYKTDYKSKK